MQVVRAVVRTVMNVWQVTLTIALQAGTIMNPQLIIYQEIAKRSSKI